MSWGNPYPPKVEVETQGYEAANIISGMLPTAVVSKHILSPKIPKLNLDYSKAWQVSIINYLELNISYMMILMVNLSNIADMGMMVKL